MNENIKKFLEKIGKDPELEAKMSKIKDPEEAYKLASSVQDGFTKEEFVDTMEKLSAESIKNGDISEEDLKKLSGGGTIELTVSGGVTAASSIVGSIAAFSAAI